MYYGDNLDILREHIKDESVDLIYLDPPFNSARNYNVLFKDESGRDSESQITAFEDTWHWGADGRENYQELVTDATGRVSATIGALRTIVGTNETTNLYNPADTLHRRGFFASLCVFASLR
jgi:site-specific DNA-methyltransferase (adenine-specific)